MKSFQQIVNQREILRFWYLLQCHIKWYYHFLQTFKHNARPKRLN